MRAVLVGCAILFSLAVVNAACGFDTVDLSGLTKATDYTGTDSQYNYKMNVCSPLADSNCAGYGMCQFDQMGVKVAGLGKWDGATWAYQSDTDKTKGVKATFTNGDSCWMGTPQVRNVIINFDCDTDSNTFTIVESPTCTFTITMKTKKACQGGGGGGGGGGSPSSGTSGGTVFLIIFFVAVPLYIIAGCIYKSRKLGTSGKESCPNYDFWKEVPGYVKDGFRFVFSGCKRGGNYNQL